MERISLQSLDVSVGASDGGPQASGPGEGAVRALGEAPRCEMAQGWTDEL